MPYKLVPPKAGKTPYWSVRGTHVGVYLDKSTKTASRKLAARFLVQWREQAERDCLARPGEPTFEDAVVNYLAAHGEDRFLEPVAERLGAKLLREIDQRAIDELAIALYPGKTAATRNRQVYTPVSAVLKHAGVDWKLRRPKGWRGNKRTLWMKPEQAFRLFAAADKVDGEFGLFLRVLCYTGMRLSEACGMKVDNLDLPHRYALVPTSKNGDPRGVFLPPHIVARLANHPRGLDRKGEKVFRFVKCGRLYTLMRQAKKGAGADLAFVTFHVFCHTWATWMRRFGGLDTRGLVGTGRWRDEASAVRYEHVVASEESERAIHLPVEKTGTRRIA